MAGHTQNIHLNTPSKSVRWGWGSLSSECFWEFTFDSTKKCGVTTTYLRNNRTVSWTDQMTLEKWHFCPTLYIIFIYVYSTHFTEHKHAEKGLTFFSMKNNMGKNITGTLSNAFLNEKDIAHSNIDFNSATNRYVSREHVWGTIMNVLWLCQAFYLHTIRYLSFQGYKKMAPFWNEKNWIWSSEDV